MTLSSCVNMEDEAPRRRYRFILDFKCQFPEKLYDVANDGYLVHWNRNGSVSVTSEEEFEEKVMKLYPGFLQIPSFQNFKRLFREYGFDRDINQSGNLEWSHPCFVRGRRELVQQIRTRRKSFRTPLNDPTGTPDSVIIPTEKHRRYSVRKRKKTKPFTPGGGPDIGGCGEGLSTETNTYVIKPPNALISEDSGKSQVVPNGQTICNIPNNGPINMNQNANAVSNTFNPNKFMDNFAEKEFNEEEYKQWIAKKRKLDEEKKDTEHVFSPKTIEQKTNEYWWMYENKAGGEIVQTVNLSTKQSSGPQGETCTPCGFCKCCSAISNYVHLFGEIPENIQVIDYTEEVVQTSKDIPTDSEVDIHEQTHATEITVIETTQTDYHKSNGENTDPQKDESAMDDILIEDVELANTHVIISAQDNDPEDISGYELILDAIPGNIKSVNNGDIELANKSEQFVFPTTSGNLETLVQAVSAVENSSV